MLGHSRIHSVAPAGRLRGDPLPRAEALGYFLLPLRGNILRALLTSHFPPSHGRHIELIGRWLLLRRFRRAVIPALHDALITGIKADTFLAVSVIIAEE
jgi:hypothetical protein